ncbi:hypothetical protein OS493_014789 [Desmophyllum pertusum]|uniref:Uncharacterized protein n=1 Tax=Desmophyllum pertusum TaxID=174260 RepID=A0A9W9YD75_9CNID|nr:hypothetical protein OS493_014789 [Desmophyllum pertusum]
MRLSPCHSLLDNNPVECDCGITPSVWRAKVTGTCAQPPHLKGVKIDTIQVEDFKCADSCTELFTRGRRSDGVYNLRLPPISQYPIKQRYFRAWCDMSCPEGPWLVLQQRSNASVNFSRNWIKYEFGFGKHDFEFWLGNYFMHAITLEREHVLRVEKSYIDGRNQTYFSEYDNFRVSSPFSNYILHVGEYRGNLGDILLDSNNSAFSTWDRDNDKVNGSCARMNKGAWWYGATCDIPDLNSMLKNVTAQGLIKVTMKTKELLRGNCNSSTVLGRAECGWPNITKEQCLARDCCYNNDAADNVIKCFVKPHFVFLERIGCFSIEKELVNSLQYQRPPLDRRFHPVHTCASAAWSRGLKIFAVRNGSECLGDKNISAILPRLSASGGCLGGRGGQNVADIYRFTIFVAKISGLKATPSRAPDLVTSYNTSSTSLVVRWSHVKKQYFYGQPIGYKIVYYPLDLESDVFSVSVDYTTNITTLADLAVYTMYVINVSAISSGGVGPAKTTKVRTGAIAPSRAPDLVTSYNTSSTSLVVRWSHVKKQYFYGQPIGYKIVYYPLDLESDVFSVSVDYTTNITTLADLAVYTMYVINVSAISSGGVGPAKTTKARTGAIAPSRAPDLVTSYNTSSTSLVVRWSHVKKQYFYGQPIGYKIVYYPLDLESDVFSVTVNYTTNITTLADLAVYTMYVINVSAISSGGVGPAKTTKARTGAIAPSRAPDLVTSYNTSSTSLVVRWSHVKKQYFYGQPIGYKIVYYPLDLESDVFSVTVNYTTNITTLADLAVYTMYVINVSAISSGGVGPAKTTKARTGAIAPSRAPDLVTSYNTSSTSLVVRWSHVKKQYFYGQPIGYKIVYYPLDLESDVFSVTVNYTTNITTLADLAVYTMYVINVSAIGSGGVGPAKTTKARTGAIAPSRAPDLVTSYNTSSTSLVVRWSHVKKQYFYGQPIGYKIVYYPLDLESDVFSVTVNYTTNITTLADLAVYTMYVINVSAISSGGVGPTKTTKARTGAIAPSRAPDLVTSYNTSSTSLVVRWSHVKKQYFYGQPIGYKIVYYPLDLESDVFSVTVNYTTNITTLADLAVYNMYFINVSAISSGGVGPANTTKARTGAIAPSRAPDLVTSCNTSSTSLVVRWSHVKKQYFYGQPIGYKIVYYPLDLESDVFSVSVDYTTNITTLADLAVYTMYVINVSAISSGGVGPAKTTKARTGAIAPTRPPSQIFVDATSSTSLNITWSSVPEQHRHGEILMYLVYISRADSQNDYRTFRALQPTQYVIGDLEANTLYAIWVSARNNIGEGTKSEAVTVRTMEGVPSAAPMNLRSVHSDSSSIIVEWDPIPKGSENGVLQGYKVVYMALSRYADLETNHDDYSAVLLGLGDDLLYTIKVAAYTKIGTGDFSQPIQVRTNKCK